MKRVLVFCGWLCVVTFRWLCLPGAALWVFAYSVSRLEVHVEAFFLVHFAEWMSGDAFVFLCTMYFVVYFTFVVVSWAFVFLFRVLSVPAVWVVALAAIEKSISLARVSVTAYKGPDVEVFLLATVLVCGILIVLYLVVAHGVAENVHERNLRGVVRT